MSEPAMLDCEAVMRRLWDYLDGELDASRRAQVAAHLEACRACAGHFAFEQSFLDLMGKVREGEPGASGELRSRVAELLAREKSKGAHKHG